MGRYNVDTSLRLWGLLYRCSGWRYSCRWSGSATLAGWLGFAFRAQRAWQWPAARDTRALVRFSPRADKLCDTAGTGTDLVFVG